MTASGDERERLLDAALGSLPREVAPFEDLWPRIERQLEPAVARRRNATWWQLAAAVVLVVSSSLLTSVWLHRQAPAVAQQPSPAPVVMPVSAAATFAGDPRLDAGYLEARRQLAKALEARIDGLPESARLKLEANLAEMRRAAEEINAALARQPDDPLLQELLLNTYQDELAVMASVNQLTTQNGNGVPGEEPRLQL